MPGDRAADVRDRASPTSSGGRSAEGAAAWSSARRQRLNARRGARGPFQKKDRRFLAGLSPFPGRSYFEDGVVETAAPVVVVFLCFFVVVCFFFDEIFLPEMADWVWVVVVVPVVVVGEDWLPDMPVVPVDWLPVEEV